MVLTCIIMIFGTLYLAMPLGIVGVRYSIAWREHDEHVAAEKAAANTVESIIPAIEPGSPVRGADDTLRTLKTTSVTTRNSSICENFYDMSSKLMDIQVLVKKLLSSPDSPLRENESRLKAQNESSSKILDLIMGVLKVHKIVCSEIRELVVCANSPSKNSSTRQASVKSSFSKRDLSFVRATSMFSRARRALTTVSSRQNIKLLQHVGPPTFRSRCWDILEHHDISRRAVMINKLQLYIVVLSIALFYLQTTPELQLSGEKTLLCRRTIKDFCHTYDRPGCYVFNASGVATTEKLKYNCKDTDTSDYCYGQGYNFGSDNFNRTCAEVFGSKGVLRVCKNRLCSPIQSTPFCNMEPNWIYIEFFFGIYFTAEVIFRIYVHPNRRLIWQDFPLYVDLIALLPFYVEVGTIISGTVPIYSVVPTAPSFFTTIRVFKTFRVLKLGAHYPGSAVLTRTATLVYKRLTIPVSDQNALFSWHDSHCSVRITSSSSSSLVV